VTLQSYLDDFATLVRDSRGQPTWLAGIRRSAIERFQSLGFPTRRDEDWHFTSAAPIAEEEFTPMRGPADASAALDVRAADLEPFLFDRHDWPRLVFVNGQLAPDLGVSEGVPRGVHLSSLADAIATDAVGVHDHLTAIAGIERNAFAALNTALFTDGVFIHVGAGVSMDRPVHVLYVSTPEAAKGVSYPRALVVLGAHASLTLVETYVAVGEATYFTNSVCESSLGGGAQLTHIRVQRESDRSFHVGLAQAHQARDSRLASFSFATGAALSRANIYTSLAGAGAEVTLDGLYLVDGTQHVDHQTRIEHIAPHCASHEVYKGILDGAAHGVFNGKVYVHPEAQKTDGKQTNNNLLLSPDAQVDTKPQLEIFADDVKCTHGATVGRLDEVALFYLKSRGLPADQARMLLTYAFAADVLQRIADPAIRETLQRVVRARFVEAPALAAT
jgi:Fe-S cluster assembly protein SufD